MKNKFYNRAFCIVCMVMVLHLLPQILAAQRLFTLNGNGSQLAYSDSSFRLTTATGNQWGTIWYKKKADLTHDFTMAATLNFGTNSGTNGADGITFAFQNYCSSAGGAGGGIGIGGVSPSLVVEFDTYQNGNYSDPAYDHVAIEKNGDVNHATANNLVAPVQIDANSTNVKNGNGYHVRFAWTVADSTLRVWVNGNLRTHYTGNVVANIFSGSPYVYWGFTAATGGSANLQTVSIDTLPTNGITLNNAIICRGQSKQVSLPGYSSYAWSPKAGVNDTTIYNPILSPTVTSTYVVAVTDACNNVQRDTLTVTVNQLPNVTIAPPFAAKCIADPAVALTGGSPTGGTYSGHGVAGNQFTAANAGLGATFITYTYTNNQGCAASDSFPVIVHSLPNVTLAAQSAICDNANPITLSGGSPSGGTFSGNGITGGNTFNPSVAGAGTTAITYTYTDGNGCPGSDTKNITVNAAPSATINTPNGTVICSGSSINLTTTAASGISFQWLLNATTVTGLSTSNTTYTASATGSYTLYASSTNGCNNTSTAINVTSGTTPTGSITSAATQFCPGASIALNSSLTGGETIAWYIGNNLIQGADLATYNANTAGDYKAMISATGCSATSNTISLTQLPGVAASISSSLPAFCPGITSINLTAATAAGVTFQWLNGGTSIPSATSAVYSATSAGSYSVIASLNTCTDTSTIIVLNNASNPVVNLTTADSSFCPGTGSLTATSITGANYAWYKNGILLTGVANSNTIAVDSTGGYNVVLTDSNQCTSPSNTIGMLIQVAPPAIISASNTIICSGNSVTLTANAGSGYTYQWKKAGTSLGAATANNTYSANQAGNYTCDVSNGCITTSNTLTLTALSAPGAPANIYGTATPCVGDYDGFSIDPVAGASSYTWSFSPVSAASISTGQGTTDVSVAFLDQDITLTVVANNACGSGTGATGAITIDHSFFCNGSDVSFGATHATACVGGSVTFNNYSDQSAVSSLSPIWYFGDGATPDSSLNSGPVTVTYTTPGMKTVTLAYYDFFGNLIEYRSYADYINISGSISTSAISGTTNLPTCSGITESYSVTNTVGSTYHWAVTGGSVTSGQGTSSASVNFTGNTGNVSVTETNAAGCVGTPVTLNASCLTTAIEESTLSEITVNIYPNPGHDIITLECNNLVNHTTATLFDVTGRQVQILDITMPKQEWDISGLSEGTYFINIHNDNFNHTYKIQKQ